YPFSSCQGALPNSPSHPRVASSDFFPRNSLIHPVTTVTASRFVFSRWLRGLIALLTEPTVCELSRSARLMILICLPLSIGTPLRSQLRAGIGHCCQPPPRALYNWTSDNSSLRFV